MPDLLVHLVSNSPDSLVSPSLMICCSRTKVVDVSSAASRMQLRLLHCIPERFAAGRLHITLISMVRRGFEAYSVRQRAGLGLESVTGGSL